MAGNLNLAQLTLCAGIDSLGQYNVLDPTDRRPRLRAWHQALSERASLKQTHPVTQPSLA